MQVRIATLVLTGIVCLLSGCGGGGGGDSGPNPPPSSDTTPNAFTFANQNGADPSDAVTSNAVTITGINAAASISITGGEYSIGSGAFTSAAGTVSNNQVVRVRLESAGDFSTPASAVLSVGGVSGTFTVTTRDPDTTPAPFTFAFKVDAARGEWTTSDAVTITDIEVPVAVSIVDGEYSIDGGAYTSSAGTIGAGQTISVRAMAGANYSAVTRARLTVSTVTQEFEVVAELPAYLPDSIAYDGDDTIFLLSNTHRLIFRWSIEAGHYLDPLALAAGTDVPAHMVYSPGRQRLYFGYGSGAITQMAVTAANPAEVAFATAPAGVTSVGAAGNFIIAQTSGYDGGYIFDGSGVEVDKGGYYYGYSRETAWDPVSGRLYYTRDGISPNDLHYDVIDQATGLVTTTGETPYHGEYGIQGPIRVSDDGQYVLLGSGNIYSRTTNLTWAGSVAGWVADARWFADGSLVTLAVAGNQTTLRRLSSSNLSILELRAYVGTALRIVGSDSAMAVVIARDNDVEIHGYVPDDDSDDDGVANTEDAFPLDVAASVDADRDGFPDAWNTGRDAGDSTTGLVLDAFPADAACWLSTHGSGGACDYGATIPDYTPDQVAQDGDVVYLLSSANRRVYRWSISAGAYLNPLVVGMSHGFSTSAPTVMALSDAHDRLYLGYASGEIHYVDLAGSSPVEVPFTNAAAGIYGLASAGNFLAVQTSGYNGGGYVYSQAGVITAQGGYYYGYSREATWDPVNSRLYYTRDGISPNDLHYDVIDASGDITASMETPYHGSYLISPPIRVSANGQYILLGSGDIYSQADLTWSGSLGGQVADARWLANGSLVTLSTTDDQTTLRRFGATNLTVLEQLTFTGQALRVVGSDDAMAVLVLRDGTVHFHSYVPSDDSDGDGVLNTEDAFPLDPAASEDSDRDGFPDAWNAGRDVDDSTTGLELDAFPQDAACWLPAHGSGSVCDYGATIPDYVPDAVAQGGDVVYLLSSANRRVYRWSISGNAYLNPYVIGINQGFSTLAPTRMTYSDAHQRLYLGYESGAIRYVDVSAGNPGEQSFVNVATGVGGLAAVGNHLLAQDFSGAWATHYVIDPAGVITEQREWNYYSTEYAWDPVTARVYFFRSDTSPGDLHFEVIDQMSGLITGEGETPYHGDYAFGGVIRVSADGEHVLVGSGDLYARNGLTWSGSVGGQIADGRWLANGSLVTLTTNGGQTVLRRLGATALATLEQITYTGQPLRVVGSDASMAVLVIQDGTVQFHPYAPSDDSDGDGIENTQDAFPLDVAASVDSDVDGYPDAWNDGRSEADSTTGLVLDAFPQDAACWLPAHGSGGVCDYGATIPNYTPDAVAQDGDVVYLLSASNRRVYRWSMSTSQYLNPYVVGINTGFSTIAPSVMAFSPTHGRLYLGYQTGAIRYIDVDAASAAELAFATTAAQVTGMASVGNYLLAQGGSGYVFDSAGVIRHQGGGYYYGYSSQTAWDPVTSRVYYTRDGISPNDLHYDVIDQATGQVTASGETPYHGSYTIQSPIRVSVNGQLVLLGSGDIYNQNGLTWNRSLGGEIADGRWLADGSLVTLSTSGSQTTLRRHAGTSMMVVEQLTYAGTPLRVLGSDAAMLVLVNNGGAVQFVGYVPNDDSDGDGVPNTDDAFPLDVAASVDTDRDGYPDAWNDGRSEADSTTGLALDAFPQDSACWLPAHGSGGVCDFSATMPNYTPDQVAQDGDLLYLLSTANGRVYRWSLATGSYLNPYVVGLDPGNGGIAPTDIAFSAAHGRLYLGYPNGAIQYIDVNAASPVETPFVNVATEVGGIAAVGNYLLAQDFSGAWATHYVIDAAGTISDQAEWNHHSLEYAWDPNTSRVYWFSMWSPSDLNYEVIDQGTGQIIGAGETPYHGTYNTIPPIRLSPDGQRILLGGGDIFRQDTLAWVGSLGKQVRDAHWTDDHLVTLDDTDLLEIRNPVTRAVLASYQYVGQPLRVVFGTSEAYLVHVMGGTTAFVRLPFYDADADTLPRWWEQLHGLDDDDADDATADPDGDGLNNLDEYAHHADPNDDDTDGDGLSDFAEIDTHSTNPARADSDDDGLSDHAEIVTHGSNPSSADSDGDGFPDLIEVLQGGNPVDVSVLPQAYTSYLQTFEDANALAGWTTPDSSVTPWVLDDSMPVEGSLSLASGVTGASQSSSVRFRGFFMPGQLQFMARVDAGSCCNVLHVVVDGVTVTSISGTPDWALYSVPLGAIGIREIEWRYDNNSFAGQPTDAARIDNVRFTAF